MSVANFLDIPKINSYDVILIKNYFKRIINYFEIILYFYIDIPIHFISPTKVGILTHLEFIPQGWLDLKRLLNMGPNEE